MTNSDKERTELTSYKIVTLVLAALLGTAVHGILLQSIENQRLAYFISASIFSVIFIFPPIVTAIVCKVSFTFCHTANPNPNPLLNKGKSWHAKGG